MGLEGEEMALGVLQGSSELRNRVPPDAALSGYSCMSEDPSTPEVAAPQPAVKQSGNLLGIIVLLVTLVPMLSLMWWYFSKAAVPQVVQETPATVGLPRSAPLADQPADLIREECLGSVTSKLQSPPKASYDPDKLPEFVGGQWAWSSSVEEFVGGAEVPRAFNCTVEGSTLEDATVSTTLQ